MKVELLAWTPQPEELVAMAAKLCYSQAGISELSQNLDRGKVTHFINKLIKMGHLSPFEHINFTFGIEGISRATSHQLVRHRIASYSQQSQRYVKFTQVEYVVPDSIKEKGIAQQFTKQIQGASRFYEEMLKEGIPAEDARYILPNASATKIIVTMNARELFHFFSLRCCERAQWEIRAMANEMLAKVKGVAPEVFVLAGPPCLRGTCPEGELSCGKPKKSPPR